MTFRRRYVRYGPLPKNILFPPFFPRWCGRSYTFTMEVTPLPGPSHAHPLIVFYYTDMEMEMTSAILEINTSTLSTNYATYTAEPEEAAREKRNNWYWFAWLALTIPGTLLTVYVYRKLSCNSFLELYANNHLCVN